jgi:hypothetical protein
MPAHGYFCADAAAVNAMASGSQVTLGQQRAAIGKARRATRTLLGSSGQSFIPPSRCLR